MLVIADHDRVAAGLLDPIGDRDRIGVIGQLLAEHDEFVAAEPRDRVAGA